MRLCLKGDTYDMFGHLKSKILVPAQRDLKNTTEIKFEMEFIKSGRQVTAVKFNISKNTSAQPFLPLPEFWEEYSNNEVLQRKEKKKLMEFNDFKRFYVNESKFKKGSMICATIDGISAYISNDGQMLSNKNVQLSTKEENNIFARLYRKYLNDPEAFYL